MEVLYGNSRKCVKVVSSMEFKVGFIMLFYYVKQCNGNNGCISPIFLYFVIKFGIIPIPNGYVVLKLVEFISRLLTAHGSADQIVPVEDAKEFAKILPNHQLKIIEGANHGYTFPSKKKKKEDELVSAVLSFVKDCVQHVEHANG